MNNYCYTTLLGTDSYLPGVLGLNYSLKKVNSKYPLVVIVPSNINEKSIQVLEQNNILYKKVKNYSFFNNISNITYKSTFNKFHCFSFEEYEKILFLDADIVVYNNLDYYFLLEPFCGNRGWAGTLTGGIFLITPDKSKADYIFNEFSYCENDEQILNILFLEEFLQKKNYLLEENGLIYHCPDDKKYWDLFNLKTPEDIKYFIENNLWLLKLKDTGYDNEEDHNQNPQLKMLYNNFKNNPY